MGHRTEKIEQLLQNSIVFIKGSNGNDIGNGLFISKEYLITNYHLVEGRINEEVNCSCVNNENCNFTANVVKYDQEKDFAILKVKLDDIEKISDEHDCAFLSREFPEKGELVIYAGKLQTNIIEEFNIDIKYAEHIGDKFLKVGIASKPIIKGNSGSAIFDKKTNTVCAIIHGYKDYANETTLIIPTSIIVNSFNEDMKNSFKSYHNKLNLKWLSLLDCINVNKKLDELCTPEPPDDWVKLLKKSTAWRRVFDKFINKDIDKIDIHNRNVKALFVFKRFVINEEGIENLELIRNFIHLKELTIKNTKITDIKPIENLYALEKLELSNNENLRDIEIINDFVKLKELGLSYTNIESLKPMIDNKNISNLKLDYTNIKDMKSIDTISNLKILSLKGVELDDDIIIALCKLGLTDLTCKCNESQFIKLINNLDFLRNITINRNCINEEKISNILKENKSISRKFIDLYYY